MGIKDPLFTETTITTILPLSWCAEPLSSLLHLAGAIAFLVATPFLLNLGRANRSHRIALMVFAFSCVLLLAVSGVYHLLPLESTSRGVFQRLDHAAIFILIAATFTPLHVIMLRGVHRWGTLSLVWFLAIVGVTISTALFSVIPEWTWLVFYLSLGWLGTLSASSLKKQHGSELLRPLISGGVCYTFGSVLEFLRFPVVVPQIFGPHEFFHIAVLGGITFHWILISRCAANSSLNKLK